MGKEKFIKWAKGHAEAGTFRRRTVVDAEAGIPGERGEPRGKDPSPCDRLPGNFEQEG